MMCAQTFISHLVTFKDTTMYNIFTTGYSNKIAWYTVNEDTLKINNNCSSLISSKCAADLIVT